MRKLSKMLMAAALAAYPVFGLTAKTTLFICGDSTMANYATDGSTPTRGWGQYFGTFFSSDIDVVNYGKGGMDVQNFYTSASYWPTIKAKLQPGDYVLMQFGHNDEKNGGMDGRKLKAYYESIGDKEAANAVDTRGTEPSGTYVETFAKLVDEVRAAGATPIFATPICRMNFTGNDIRRAGRHDLGDSFSLLTPNGPTTGNKIPSDDHTMDYPYQLIKLAGEKNVDFIDMTQDTRELFVMYGDDRTHSILSDGDGSTHLSVAGAALIARRAAGLMQDKGILSQYVQLGDAAINFTTDGNFGTAYVGNILTKEFTVTGFGLTPEKGNADVSISDGFELSLDKNEWSSSIKIPYEGGTLINTFYARTSVDKDGETTGELKVSTGSTSTKLDLVAVGEPIPGTGKFTLAWPLAKNDAYDMSGEMIPVAMNLKGLEVKGYDKGVKLSPASGWPAGDIDESPTRYVEFGVKVPEGKILTVNKLSMNVGGVNTNAMRCHVNWSATDAFGNPKTFYSPTEMKSGVMNAASTEVMLNLSEGETLLVRVYPWTSEAQQDASICVSDVMIEGYVANSSSDVSISWPLDKGVENPAAAETSSAAFSFTSYAVGKDLTVTGTGNPAGTTGTMYQPLVNNQSEYTTDGSIEFSLRPKAGLTFQPSHISFYATRNGTDGGELQASIEVGDHTEVLDNSIKPIRNNTEPKQLLWEKDLNGVVVYNNSMTFRIALKGLGNTKTMTIHSVKIEGKISGEEEQVASYTITAVPSIEEAGTVTRTPNTSKVDKDQKVTVSATENFGYKFTGWSVNGKVVSTENPYSFIAKENVNLVADYEVLTTYPLELAVEGGANDYMVAVEPAGEMIDGVPHFVAGTEVKLTASNNRILSFTNWEDNTTALSRNIVMDGAKKVTANYACEDFIVGWDFYNDEPAGDRPADFYVESDNSGMMRLHNEEGSSTTWLSRGVNRGAENDRYAGRIWKYRSDKNFFEASFSAEGYSNLKVASSLSCTYNTYTRFFVQYSLDGKTYKTLGEMQPGNRSWTDAEFDLPADANGASRVYIRWYPDFNAPLHGNETDYDGLAITDVYILAAPDAADDTTAPKLLTTIPAEGSTGASISGSVVLTYDEKVKVGQPKATLNGKELEGSVAGKVVIFKYSGLSYNTKYTFSMPEGAVIDRNGNKAAALNLNFTTMTRTVPEARLYDAIVDINGTGDYTSLQAAIDAAPANRVSPWLIFVENGRYKEHIDIPATKPFIHIIGQDRDKTVIHDDRVSGGENAVHVSVGATLVVNSNDCFFENITFENSYGHIQQNGPQALAVNTSGDRCVFNNVAMLSYQDTWITPGNSAYRVYVNNSFIEGAVDFIYNSGDIYVENTTLYITRDNGGYIVAPSHAADVKWGYVFRDCKITAPGDPSKTSVWLGRPWHNYPKTVFLNTCSEVTLPAAGWAEHMGGLPAIWAEWNTYDAKGNLLDLSQRRDTYWIEVNGEKVYGKAKNRLTDEEAAEYTLDNVLSGNDEWHPAIMTEACDAPAVKVNGKEMTWNAVPYAICYVITDGDKVVGFTTEPKYTASKDATNFVVRAVNEFGGLSGNSTNTTGVDGLEADGDFEIVGIYDINGVRLAEPINGINIIVRENAAGMRKVEKLMINK